MASWPTSLASIVIGPSQIASKPTRASERESKMLADSIKICASIQCFRPGLSGLRCEALSGEPYLLAHLLHHTPKF